LHNNISANFSKFRLQNFKSSSAYITYKHRRFLNFLLTKFEKIISKAYITYKHRRFLNFLLTKFEKIISKVGAIHELPLQFLQKVL